MESSVTPARLKDFTGPRPTAADITDTGFRLPAASPTLASLTFEDLDPARPYSIYVEFTSSAILATGSEYIRVQDTVHSFAPGEPLQFAGLQFPVDPSRPVTMEISGSLGDSDRCAVILQIRNESPAEGPQRLALTAFVPKPQYETALIGQAILGSFMLPDLSYRPEWFRLGADRLSNGILSRKPETHAWKSILDPTTVVTTTRGITYNGFTGAAEIGTLTITIYNGLDPRASTLIRGTPVRLFDTTLRERIFTGVIERTISRPAKDGTYTLELTAVDAIAQTARRKKWQDTRDPAGADLSAVLPTLLKDFTYTVSDLDPSSPRIGSIVKESSLTEYLDIYAATAGATWYVDPYNTITFTFAPETAPKAALILDGSGPAHLAQIPLVDAAADFDTDTVISTIEAANNSAEYDPETGWTGHTETFRAVNETLAAQYGSRSLTVETAAASGAALDNLLSAAVRAYRPKQVIREGEALPWITAANRRNNTEISALIGLDILDPVHTDYRNTEAIQHITRVSHTVTPHEWRTKLELVEWKI